jgi:hypothetical protein
LATAAELAKVPKSDSNVTWNATAAAQLQSEANDALVANHLDHLLAVTYDPASQPGVADALLNELIESDGGVSRFTANALEEGPGGGSAPTAAEIADAVWDEAIAGHLAAGSTGEALDNAGAAGTPPTVGEIADAVWDEDATGHQTQGSFGQAIGDPVADTNTIFKAVVTDATGATVGVDVVAVKAETAAILADTDVIGTPAAATIAADLVVIDNFVDDLESRLTSTRAGYLDNLSAGSVATASALSSVASDVTTLLGRIPAALFSGITSLAQWLGLIAGKQTGNSTARTELRATGAGSGTFD